MLWLISAVVVCGACEIAGHYPISPAFPPFSDTMTALFAMIVDGTLPRALLITLKPLAIGKFRLHYPALPIVARQLIVGPLEILAAAAIIYFALPAEHNPGYVIVLGIFLFSFAVAQASHAPGGLGVLEVVFLTGLSEMDPAAVLAAAPAVAWETIRPPDTEARTSGRAYQ